VDLETNLAPAAAEFTEASTELGRELGQTTCDAAAAERRFKVQISDVERFSKHRRRPSRRMLCSFANHSE
jgi:histone H3/H4